MIIISVSPQTAYQITSYRGVVKRTGKKLNKLKLNLGKTGTTNENTDAWFLFFQVWLLMFMSVWIIHHL